MLGKNAADEIWKQFYYVSRKMGFVILVWQSLINLSTTICFKKEYEKCQNFLSENLHFLVAKFSVYLNRHVFIM